MKKLIAAAAFSLALVACGDDGSTGVEYNSIDEAMEGMGCERGQIDDNPVTMFAVAEGYCDDGREVVLFNTEQARDNFIDIAREFGSEPIEVGGNYAIYPEGGI